MSITFYLTEHLFHSCALSYTIVLDSKESMHKKKGVENKASHYALSQTLVFNAFYFPSRMISLLNQ